MQYERRSFGIDVTVCPRCSGPLRVIATIRSPQTVRAILEWIGLPSRAPPLVPAEPADVVLPVEEFGPGTDIYSAR